MTETTFVVDFSADLLYYSEEIEGEIHTTSFVANITPNNFVAALDFFKHNNHSILPESLSEIDYSVAEY